jgi:hypothetical protein
MRKCSPAFDYGGGGVMLLQESMWSAAWSTEGETDSRVARLGNKRLIPIQSRRVLEFCLCNMGLMHGWRTNSGISRIRQDRLQTRSPPRWHVKFRWALNYHHQISH